MICAAKSIHHPDQDWPRYIKVQLNYIQLYHYGICTSPSIQSLLNAEYIGVVPLEKGPLLDYCAPPQHIPGKHTWWHLYFQLYPIPCECKIYRSGPPGQGSFIGLLHPTQDTPGKQTWWQLYFPLSNPFWIHNIQEWSPWKRVLYWTNALHPNTPLGQQTWWHLYYFLCVAPLRNHLHRWSYSSWNSYTLCGRLDLVLLHRE